MTIPRGCAGAEPAGAQGQADEAHLPMEVIEHRALRKPRGTLAQNYGLKERQVAQYLATSWHPSED